MLGFTKADRGRGDVVEEKAARSRQSSTIEDDPAAMQKLSENGPAPTDALTKARQAAYWQRRELLTLADALAGEMEGTVQQVKAGGDKANDVSTEMRGAIQNVEVAGGRIDGQTSWSDDPRSGKRDRGRAAPTTDTALLRCNLQDPGVIAIEEKQAAVARIDGQSSRFANVEAARDDPCGCRRIR